MPKIERLKMTKIYDLEYTVERATKREGALVREARN